MAGKACESLGSRRGESHWCLEGDDGDRASDNQSTEETWPLDTVLRLLHELGHWGSEVSGETRTGVSYLIYELKNYSKVCTTYIQEGEPRTVRKRKLRMSKSY